MTVKMLFLISPPYDELQTSASRWPKLRMMAVSLRVPSMRGSQLEARHRDHRELGDVALVARRAELGLMNMLRANRLCQACSVMMRIGIRYSGSAPT